jgi:peptide/nickel transport system substrate-binding protein
MDPAQRNAALSKVMEAYMADQGLIPVFYPVFDYATRKGLAVTHRPQRRFNALMIRPVP